MVNTVVSVNCDSSEKPLLAANTARSSAWLPMAMAGRGVRSSRVEMMPNGMLSSPKCESDGTDSQDSPRVRRVSKDIVGGVRGERGGRGERGVVRGGEFRCRDGDMHATSRVVSRTAEPSQQVRRWRVHAGI